MDKLNFIQIQNEFTQYIRNPDTAPAPKGIEKRRADIYRDLFFNNIEGFLADNFPVLKSTIGEELWLQMTRDFFARHTCSSPYFSDIPEAFISYLQSDENKAPLNAFPFLLELAHYEWTELVITIADHPAEDEQVTDIEQQVLTLSKSAWPLAYQYPVHKISPSFIPSSTPDEPTYLVVYRNTDDDVVFLETNPTTHSLLDLLLKNSQQPTVELLAKFAIDLKHPKPNVVIEGGLIILKDFVDRGILIPA